MAIVARKRKIWTASITDRGRFYLDHGRHPPPLTNAADSAAAIAPDRRRDHRRDDPPLDTTARAMQRVAQREEVRDRRSHQV